jgi:23S rRNA (cytidine1920-2'-O)/16S rRNA (cytidine1409-2'-O)-methyltransferase
VRRKLVESRTEARRVIDAGLVRVRGNPAPKPSTLVAPGDPLSVDGPAAQFVSRAGAKLEGALEVFGIPTTHRRAVDVGASTGGFSDCLLQRGVAEVVAVDVGYGQMHNRVRSDDRVVVVERTNIRHADPAALGAPFDLIVADLSFISLALVAPQLAALGSAQSDWVLLVKPQFEVGKELVGKGGIVRDPEAHVIAIEQAATALSVSGIGVVGLVVSSIRGTEGNREFLVHGRIAERAIDAGTVRGIVLEESQS